MINFIGKTRRGTTAAATTTTRSKLLANSIATEYLANMLQYPALLVLPSYYIELLPVLQQKQQQQQQDGKRRNYFRQQSSQSEQQNLQQSQSQMLDANFDVQPTYFDVYDPSSVNLNSGGMAGSSNDNNALTTGTMMMSNNASTTTTTMSPSTDNNNNNNNMTTNTSTATTSTNQQGTSSSSSSSNEMNLNLNGKNNIVLGHVPILNRDQVRICIEQSYETLSIWRDGTTGLQRSKYLQLLCQLIEYHKDDLALIMTSESGKPLSESYNEIMYGCSFLEASAADAVRPTGAGGGYMIPSPFFVPTPAPPIPPPSSTTKASKASSNNNTQSSSSPSSTTISITQPTIGSVPISSTSTGSSSTTTLSNSLSTSSLSSIPPTTLTSSQIISTMNGQQQHQSEEQHLSQSSRRRPMSQASRSLSPPLLHHQLSSSSTTATTNNNNHYTNTSTTIPNLSLTLGSPKGHLMAINQAVGVCALITPWNFPFAMIARKVGPALAAGCTVIVKPSELTPLTALALQTLADMAGIPNGVYRTVTPDADRTQDVGFELCTHPFVRKISFTGSTDVGKQLMKWSSSTVKRLSLELGGNAPFVVFDDTDLDVAVNAAFVSKFRNAGQTCICSDRFLIQETIHDEFVHRLKQLIETKLLKHIGPGIDPTNTMGPLITTNAVKIVHKKVTEAINNGAICITGGHPLPSLGSHYFQPTILTNVSIASSIWSTETFGPVVAIRSFRTEEEALTIVNDCDVGLAAYFCTKDLGRAFRFAQRLECGMVGVNEGIISTCHAPFGGVKESGLGREGSVVGIGEYLETKYIMLNY